MERAGPAIGLASGPVLTRRRVLGLAAMLTAAGGLPVSARTVVRLARGAGAQVVPQRALLRAVAQLVLPRTQTAGAGEVGTGDFVLLALAHGLEGAHRPLPADADPALHAHARADGTLDHVGWLGAELDRRGGGAFLALPPVRRHDALAALDADAFAGVAASQPWRAIKALILTGYYTSRVGGAEELRYEPVPGRFDPDLPLDAQTRAISNDWSAVDFG